MTTRSMTWRWMTRGKSFATEWWSGLNGDKTIMRFRSEMTCSFAFRVKTISRAFGRRPDPSEFPSEDCPGERGWGAVAGRGRAALFQSWMTWRWSQTPHFPARRTSSVKLSRSPRIFKSCCELLRRTNMTGQSCTEGLNRFRICCLYLISSLKPTFFSSSWTWFFYVWLCVCPAISHDALLPWLLTPSFCSTLPPCCHVLVSRLPLTPLSRPCEREGVRRLRHSLGCFSTLVPWAEKPPPSLQPLSLRAPDPTSWYSGLCPCLPGTVYFPLPHTAWDSSPLLFLLLSPANEPSFWCAA